MHLRTLVLFPAALSAVAIDAPAIELTELAPAYSQNFDSLASAGTSDVLPAGWFFVETGTAANGIYTAGTGSSATGDTYSFGLAGSSDRALGTLRSGSLVALIGASFTNGGSLLIEALEIAYMGEQWRLGAAGRADRLDFQYSLDASSLLTGTWTTVDALGFTSPFTTATGQRNGNLAENQMPVSGMISGLGIAPGAAFWLRWSDFDASGSDDGLAIDDFTLTARYAVPPVTSVPDGLPAGFAGMAIVLAVALPGWFGRRVRVAA
jgi:hypothetical protein